MVYCVFDFEWAEEISEAEFWQLVDAVEGEVWGQDDFMYFYPEHVSEV